MVAYQQGMAQYYNSHVRNKEFKADDLVLHRAKVSQPTEHGKLSSKWEGSYQVDEVIRSRTYHLKQLDGAL